MPVGKKHLYLLFWIVLGAILITIGITLLAIGGKIPMKGYEKSMVGLVLFVAGVGVLVGIEMGWEARGIK